MALFNDIVSDHSTIKGDLSHITGELDGALFNVGVSVRMMRNVALHGGSHGRRDPQADAEEIGAIADVVLSYLGRLGLMVDEFEKLSSADRRQRPLKAA